MIYPELHALVGGSVPNYQGMFLRGLGGNAAPLGQYQGDAIRNITGMSGMSHSTITPSGSFYSGRRQDGYILTGSWNWHVVYMDASRVVPTADENRPVNKAVRYMIRAR